MAQYPVIGLGLPKGLAKELAYAAKDRNAALSAADGCHRLRVIRIFGRRLIDVIWICLFTLLIRKVLLHEHHSYVQFSHLYIGNTTKITCISSTVSLMSLSNLLQASSYFFLVSINSDWKDSSCCFLSASCCSERWIVCTHSDKFSEELICESTGSEYCLPSTKRNHKATCIKKSEKHWGPRRNGGGKVVGVVPNCIKIGKVCFRDGFWVDGVG